MSSVEFPKQVILGYAGETNARSIGFDCSEEFEKWPDAEPTVMYVRPTENKNNLVYPGATSVDGNIVYWTPDAFAMELEGTDGYCQIFFYGRNNDETNDPEEPEETDVTEGSEDEEDSEETTLEYLGKSALVRTTVLPALWAQQSDPILESVEYTTLFRRMQNAAKLVERLRVTAVDGDQAAAEVTNANGGLRIDFTIPIGKAFEYSDFTEEQLESLRGPRGFMGAAFTYEDFTPEQLAALKGEKGDQGDPGTLYVGDLDAEQQEELLGRLQWISVLDVDNAFAVVGLSPAS